MHYRSKDLRDLLVHTGHAVVRAGLVVGSGGNLSARAPGADECWVTAAGTWLDGLDQTSFVRVRISDGAPLDKHHSEGADHSDSALLDMHRSEGAVSSEILQRVAPTSELALHLATYRARPDVNAIVHLHPQSVLLLDAIGAPIHLATTDHAFYLRKVVTTPFSAPGGAEVGDLAAAACAGGVNCVILSRHGCSVIAGSVELALKRALYLEEAAQLTYRALALGRLPAPMPNDWLDRPEATA